MTIPEVKIARLELENAELRHDLASTRKLIHSTIRYLMHASSSISEIGTDLPILRPIKAHMNTVLLVIALLLSMALTESTNDSY